MINLLSTLDIFSEIFLIIVFLLFVAMVIFNGLLLLGFFGDYGG